MFQCNKSLFSYYHDVMRHLASEQLVKGIQRDQQSFLVCSIFIFSPQSNIVKPLSRDIDV